MSHDSVRIVVAILAPPAAGLMALWGVQWWTARSLGGPARRTRLGLVLGGTQCVVQLLLVAPLLLWLGELGWSSTGRAAPRTRGGSAGALLAAFALAGVLRVASKETTRMAIRRMRHSRTGVAGSLPGVEMRRMFGQFGQRQFYGLSLLIAVVGGVYEELAYRGLLQGMVSARWGVVAGVASASAIFALAHLHYGPTGSVFALMAGLILGASVAWMGDLLPAIAAHAGYNAFTLYQAYRMPQTGIGVPGLQTNE